MLKRDILRRKDDFTSIYKKGRSVGDRYVVLFYKKNSTQKDIDNIGQEGLFVNIYKEKGRANKTMYFLQFKTLLA